MVAREYYSGQLQRLWLDGVAKPVCPFSLGENNLYVAYYASAEMNCHLVLDWSLPDYLLDLFSEFRCQTNGVALPAGKANLIIAISFFGITSIKIFYTGTLF